jgi:predicted outer membrane repeat protein
MRFLIMVSCIILVLVAFQQIQARIIHVPTEQPTIQAGINVAVNGDTVSLDDGIYTGEGNRFIDYYGKAITVRSASGNKENCIIDCQKAGCGFLFHSGEGHGSVLEGVTIKNGQYDWGGGIDCWDYSSPTLVNVLFLENTSTWGGGIRCWNSSPILIDVTFSKNSANPGGGYFGQNSSPTLINVTFSENTAIWGGGMYCDANPALTNVTFVNNRASNSGGGLYFDGGSASLTNCVFSSNYGSSDGGGIECWNSSLMLSECVFSENTTSGEAGAMFCWDSSLVHLDRCTFYGTSSYRWSGIFSGYNSAIFLVNSIVAFTRASEAVGCDGSSSATLRYCDVYGNVEGDWVGSIAGQDTIVGNISCDPMFCYPDTGNYYLLDGSCCVGAGCDSLGNPNNVVDIGAFGICNYKCGDANRDSTIDICDIVYLINFIYKDGPAPYPLSNGDVNHDGIIDTEDLFYIIHYLYQNGPPPCR